MLQNQSFASIGHDLLHTLSDIFGTFAFILDDKLDAAMDFLQTGFEVALAELGGLVQQGDAVEVEQVEDFDWLRLR